MATLFDFSGKQVIITGAASGIGAATTSLIIEHGATVHTLDVAPVNADGESYLCDLGDPGAIEATVERLPATIDVVMSCAGVPNGGRFSPEEVMKINWLGLRHLTELLLPRIPAGGSVVNIASTAGRAWAEHQTEHHQLMEAATFEAGLAWTRANPDVVGDGYAFSKEAVQFYTLWRSVQLLPAGIRMNSICPGVTNTSIIPDFRRGLGDDLIDQAEAVAGRMARPEEMAPAMLFLADQAAASYLNGVNLNIDRGTGAARASGQSDPVAIWGETESGSELDSTAIGS
ncbi:MAG: SDR family oxidoreductase [Actinomycetia bacterium]|nr:SDR family oxidoreductase [Actinomycetes bacterium]